MWFACRTLTVRQKKLQEGLKEQQQLYEWLLLSEASRFDLVCSVDRAESYKEQCASLKNQLSYKV